MSVEEKNEFLRGLYFGSEPFECEKVPDTERYREYQRMAARCRKQIDNKVPKEYAELFDEYMTAHALANEEVLFYAFTQGWDMCSKFIKAANA